MIRSPLVSIVIVFVCLATASCSSPGYEYYLDKGVDHKDVYRITASMGSDGTCSFSVDGDEAEKYGMLYWDKPQKLISIEQSSQIIGFCEEARRGPTTDSDHIPAPSLFVIITTPEEMELSKLNSGIPLDIRPAILHTFDTVPSGVIFSISGARSIKEYIFAPCGVDVVSLDGDALLQSMPDGVVTLSISALGYPKRAGC